MFFLRNHAHNVVEKLVPDPFIKTKIEHNSESTVWSVIKFGSNVFSSRDLPKYGADHLPLNKVELFLKKKRSGTSLLILFSAWF